MAYELNNGMQSIQTCNAEGAHSYTGGVFVAESADRFANVADAVRLWANGGCLDRLGAQVLSNNTMLTILTSTVKDNMNSTANLLSTDKNQGSAQPSHPVSALVTRSDCRAIQVQAGDSCASLASRCDIRGNDFVKHNSKIDLCSTLMPRQWVCCSQGDLPDMRPKAESDGTRKSHRVNSGDGCWSIADNFGIKQKDIEGFNKETWGWAGCNHLQAGQIICLSEGNTPMPAEVEGVTCGPQKPGTQKPTGSFTGNYLTKLNPCPLKACCSGWGYCGTIEEFCIESPADTGAPGAFKHGTNGCISNCGMDMVGNEMTAGGFARVGYFQGYNPSRSCLRMDAAEIPNKGDDAFTHVHFAFAGITEDFEVRIAPESQDQFSKFVKLDSTFRKVLSFGGWAESTEPATFQRHDLDGVDFDWEYPGATDIPGTPAGSADEAFNYYKFLVVVRELLGWGKKSLSIAMPSSFWYLKPFPVEKMA
ncbi:hypothetical protein QQS21_000383 [Conoideocrella luteorostrata]|uniref:LysM domain-containing protein n=1 Tax=Conoideocrella luteorostrata TaxID=1105319 RepID=A0AAJ0CZ60_9HYPO|nr:hypothetical protein QQS21_000383 [Conoideocrella luteorostrata]